MTSTLRTSKPPGTVTKYGSDYFTISEWRNRKANAPVNKGHGMTAYQHGEIDKNIERCENGKYLVSATGHRIPVDQPQESRSQQAKGKPVSMEGVAGAPSVASVKPSPTPTPPTANGEGLVLTQQPANNEVVLQAQLHSNTQKPIENVTNPIDFRLPQSSRRLQPVSSKPGWLCFNIGTGDVIMHKWYSMAALGIEEAQQESTPAPVEPAQPARHAAIECYEQALRAFIDAFFDGDLTSALHAFDEGQASRIRYAGHGMNGNRTQMISMVKRAVVRPEETIDVDENALIPSNQLPLLPGGEVA